MWQIVVEFRSTAPAILIYQSPEACKAAFDKHYRNMEHTRRATLHEIINSNDPEFAVAYERETIFQRAGLAPEWARAK